MMLTRRTWRGLSWTAEAVPRYHFVGILRKLRGVADWHAQDFESEGFLRLFAMLKRELSDEYFATIEKHLRQLKFRNGVLISAGLGKGNIGPEPPPFALPDFIPSALRRLRQCNAERRGGGSKPKSTLGSSYAHRRAPRSAVRRAAAGALLAPAAHYPRKLAPPWPQLAQTTETPRDETGGWAPAEVTTAVLEQHDAVLGRQVRSIAGEDMFATTATANPPYAPASRCLPPQLSWYTKEELSGYARYRL
jgi:hypothetical protein